jgi:hypothetical protein
MHVQGRAFLDELADFLDHEALQLERINEADGPVEVDGDNDSRITAVLFAVLMSVGVATVVAPAAAANAQTCC